MRIEDRPESLLLIASQLEFLASVYKEPSTASGELTPDELDGLLNVIAMYRGFSHAVLDWSSDAGRTTVNLLDMASEAIEATHSGKSGLNLIGEFTITGLHSIFNIAARYLREEAEAMRQEEEPCYVSK